MLSGSAVLRVSLLLLAAGCLTALVQFYWPQMGGESVTAPRSTVPSRPMPTDPGRNEVRRVESPPAPAPTSSPAPAPNPAPNLQPGDATRDMARDMAQNMPQDMARTAPPPPAPAPIPPPALAPIPRPEPAPDAALAPEQDGEPVAEGANPRAVSVVDLNTGSLAELNRLRGGGNIGRAIIQRRPYTSVDQLLSKRVLSRATYERIKDQVAVQ